MKKSITIPMITPEDIFEISESCEGECAGCVIREDCQMLRAFMDEAGEAFERQSEEVIMDLFDDPEECEKIRKEIFE